MLDIPLGFWHVAIEHVAEGDPDPWYVTFGVNVGEAESDFDTICHSIMNAYSSQFRLLLWNQVRLTGLQITIGTGGEPIRSFWNSDVSDAGGPTGGMLPQNCALLIRKNTGQGGRRQQGRMFLPLVLSEGSTNNVGYIDPASVIDYQEKATAFLAALASGVSGGAAPMVLLHNDPPTGVDPTLVTGLSVSNTISTQRRRLR